MATADSHAPVTEPPQPSTAAILPPWARGDPSACLLVLAPLLLFPDDASSGDVGHGGDGGLACSADGASLPQLLRRTHASSCIGCSAAGNYWISEAMNGSEVESVRKKRGKREA